MALETRVSLCWGRRGRANFTALKLLNVIQSGLLSQSFGRCIRDYVMSIENAELRHMTLLQKLSRRGGILQEMYFRVD